MAFGLTDKFGVLGASGTPQNYSFTFTSGVNSAYFFIKIRQSASSDEVVSGTPTFDSSNCTLLGTPAELGRTRIEVWAIDNPTTGSAANLTVAYAGTAVASIDTYVIGYGFTDGESISTATVTYNTAATAEASSLDATSESGDIVCDMVSADGTITTLAADASQTEHVNDVNTANWLGGSSETATGASTNMAWTWTTSRIHVMAAVAVATGVTATAPFKPPIHSLTGQAIHRASLW